MKFLPLDKEILDDYIKKLKASEQKLQKEIQESSKK